MGRTIFPSSDSSDWCFTLVIGGVILLILLIVALKYGRPD